MSTSLKPIAATMGCAIWLHHRKVIPLKKGLRPDSLRHRLLSSSITFICKYWKYPAIIEDERIGEAVAAAQSLTATVTDRLTTPHKPVFQELSR